MKTSVTLAVLVSLGVYATTAAAQYSVQDVSQDHPSPWLKRTTYTVQEGSDELDQFRITRVRRASGGKPILLHAPFGYDVDWYQISPSAAYHQSFLGSLASMGFDLWVIDDRLSRQAPGTCEQGACETMAHWTLQTRIDDSRFARELVLQKHEDDVPLVIGGFSGGAIYAQAVVNEYPEDYAGLFLWNGTLAADAAQQAFSSPACQALESIVAQGVVADPTPQLLRSFYTLFETDPEGLSPFVGSGDPNLAFFEVPFVAQGFPNPTNQEVFFGFHTEHFDNPNWPTPQFFFAEGSIETGLTHADLNQLLRLGDLVDNYGSVVTLRDMQCGLAGDATYTDNLAAFEGSVFALGTGGGLGPLLDHTVSLYTAANVVGPFVRADFGEVDRFFHPNRFLLLDVPFATWVGSLHH